MAMTKTQKVAAGGGGALAAALAILMPFLMLKEGLRLKAYEDVVGVWTICYGHAYVDPKLQLTKAQCEAMLAQDSLKYMKNIYALHKYEPTPVQLAAHTSFAYNIGVNGYKTSKTLRLTNAGDAAGGCRAMMNWHTPPEIIGRRTDEMNLCLQGVGR